MLKRGKQIARAIGESAGIIAPRVPDAIEAAEIHRKALTVAQAALEQADENLQAAHDHGAELAEITKQEAAQAAAKVEVQRAEARYLGAEKRLKAAQAAEAEKAKAAAAVRRDAALAAFTKAAAEIDRLADQMAAHVATIDAQYPALNEARRDGVASTFTPTSGRTLAEFAVQRAIAAQAGAWVENKPAAADLAQRVVGSVMAGAT